MLTLYHDLTSPASAVSILRVQSLADRGGNVAFVGVDMLGLAITIPATLDQLEEFERARDRALALGLAMRRPTRRPPTLDAHLVAQFAEHVELGASWRSTCLQAYFADGADLGDRLVLLDLARAAGLDPDAVAAVLDDDVERRSLRGRMSTLRRRGVGGVPLLEAGPGAFVSAEIDDDDLERLAFL